MTKDDVTYVTEKIVFCDGNGNGSDSGHPREFLHIAKTNRIECPYCNRLFVYEAPHKNQDKMK